MSDITSDHDKGQGFHEWDMTKPAGIPKVGDTVRELHGRVLFSWMQTCAACGRYTRHETRAFDDSPGPVTEIAKQAEGTVCSGCGYVSKVQKL